VTTSFDAQPAAAEPTARLAELRAATARLRTRATSDTERWLLLGGAVLVPLGLVLVVLGYWGAAHAPRVIQQIPYVMSGGFLGIGLVFAGSFSYFAWWLTRIVREQSGLAARMDAQTDALVAELSAVRAELRHLGGVVTTGPELVSTRGGELVHRPTCRVVAGRTDLRPVTDGPACKVCQPQTSF
jgi:hypothetical protein